jgi:MFS transporter, DHA1 family, inner membrane transport protein
VHVISPDRANLALSTLFLGMFVLGSAELLVVGVLNLVAADLGVSIPAAGTLVTGYALGLALGGPALTAVTIRLDRRTVLLGTLVLFVLANLVAVLVASYGLFLVARVVTGALQGLFIATAFAAGVAVVPAERVGRAISVVVAGVAVSAALGVPLGDAAGTRTRVARFVRRGRRVRGVPLDRAREPAVRHGPEPSAVPSASPATGCGVTRTRSTTGHASPSWS